PAPKAALTPKPWQGSRISSKIPGAGKRRVPADHAPPWGRIWGVFVDNFRFAPKHLVMFRRPKTRYSGTNPHLPRCRFSPQAYPQTYTLLWKSPRTGMTGTE